MVGYSDPNLGNKRRTALAQYLKGQSKSRAQAAGRMRGINTSALGRRSPGGGTPFQRGGGKASPEKFAFAGIKPSLKTLLGLVGQSMGVGGQPTFNIYGPDTPVGGLAWGGEVPLSPTTPALGAPSMSPPSGYDGPLPPGATQIGPDGVPTDDYGMPIYTSSSSPYWGTPGFGKPILGDMLYGGF